MSPVLLVLVVRVGRCVVGRAGDGDGDWEWEGRGGKGRGRVQPFHFRLQSHDDGNVAFNTRNTRVLLTRIIVHLEVVFDCTNMMTVLRVSCAKRACFAKAYYRQFVGCDQPPRLVAKQTC